MFGWLKPREKRAYTDAIVSQILANSSSPELQNAASTSALEIAAGVVSRAFAAGVVEYEVVCPPPAVWTVGRQPHTSSTAIRKASLPNGLPIGTRLRSSANAVLFPTTI